MSELLPFLATVPAVAPRGLEAVLSNVSAPSAPSPWLPTGTPSLAHEPPPSVDLDALAAQAREQGRAEGLAEMAAQRQRLQELIDALAAARAAIATTTVELVADAATAAVAAWIDHAPPRELFATIVHAWTARCRVPAIARVAPALVEDLQEAIGTASIVVEPDPSLAPGSLRIDAPTVELAHDREAYLAELRDAIVTALEAAS